MTTKLTLYRIVHEFNQEGRLAVPHIYKAQCRVFLFWHTFGTAKDEKTSMQQCMFHENATKGRGFFGRLWEVWSTKIKFSNICQ